MKIQLFNEFYGCYFITVFHIIKEAIGKELTDTEFRDLIKRMSDAYGFSETTRIDIERSLERGKDPKWDGQKDSWPFFYRETKANNTSQVNICRLNKVSDIPLSTIEKMWLKSLYTDPRIRLFLKDGYELPELHDVEPLFDWNDIVLFDQYADGDPCEDEAYIEIFHKVLEGVRKQDRLRIRIRKQNQRISFNSDGSFERLSDRGIGTIYIDPDHIEYSERDNKFRLVGDNPRFGRNMVNIAAIVSCDVVQRFPTRNHDDKIGSATNSFQKEFVLELANVNNALERFLLSFSHYNKTAEYSKERDKYQITIVYDEADESDVLIRVLSFGSHVRVIRPNSFVFLVKERLQKQIQKRFTIEDCREKT